MYRAYHNNETDFMDSILHKTLNYYYYSNEREFLVCMLFIDAVQNEYVSAIYHRIR
jgi:hypothetical protein